MLSAFFNKFRRNDERRRNRRRYDAVVNISDPRVREEVMAMMDR